MSDWKPRHAFPNSFVKPRSVFDTSVTASDPCATGAASTRVSILVRRSKRRNEPFSGIRSVSPTLAKFDPKSDNGRWNFKLQ